MSNENSAETTRPTDRLRDRRTVLRGAAVVGLAGVSAPLLAGCGDETPAGGTPTPAAPTSATSTSAPTSAAPSTPSASPSSGGGGAVLGPSTDIPVGGGKIFADAGVVVTQPTAGQFKGFSATCTHSGCTVRKVEGGTIDCLCHGSKFKVTDGSVANGPAREPLPAVAVTVQGGNIMGPAS